MATMAAPRAGGWRTTYGLPFVIGASSAGTIIEWYDFYLYATLAPFFAPVFFPNDNATASLLSAFATYALGFLVRPFGAVVFGRIGDVVGRKYAFLLTISIMGVATVGVGLLPTFAAIGIIAPVILVTLRLAQGLALGGEYGGAAIYVAEHAPDNRRGYYTAWIQTTATIGFFLALSLILIFRSRMGDVAFRGTAEFFPLAGWRYPFLISALLLAFAIYIRLRLQETPLFARLKARGETTKNTASWAKDSFSGRKIGTIALVLLGLTAGQGVVWYQGQFQALNFMTIWLKLDPVSQAYPIILWAVALGTPFFLFFGWLSDKIGRKVIILSGCLIAAVTYLPIYHAMYDAAHVVYDPATGLITKANPDTVTMIALVWIQVIYVTMVYGPIAAFLVEYFRAKVRYTSLSIPYHFGNGWFGGLLPLLFTYLVGATYPEGSKLFVPFLNNFMALPIKTTWDLRQFNTTNDPNGNIYLGLAYTITVALMSVVVGTLFLKEPKNVKIWSEVGGENELPAAGLVGEGTPAD